MGLLSSKPKLPDDEELREMDTETLLKGARRYEAELQLRRDAFEDPSKIGNVTSLKDYHDIEEFLDG